MHAIAIWPARTNGQPLVIGAVLTAAFFTTAQAQHIPNNELAPVFVTATRSPQNIAEVLSDSTIITAEDIARSGQTSLADILQRQRGVEIARNGGPGTNTSVFIRGAENKQTLVLIDGVRTGSATSGGANWASIPVSQIDRVEVVYGPLSSLYGADAVGGVIQIFTKNGSSSPTASVAASIGSYATRTLDAGISGSAGSLRYALYALHERSSGFSSTKPGGFGYNPDHDGYDKNSVNGRIGLEIAKGHDIGVHFLESRLDTQFDSNPTFDDHLQQKLGSYGVFSRNRILSNWISNLQLGQSMDQTTNRTVSTSRFDTRQTQLAWQNDITFGADLLQILLERRKEAVDSTTTALNRERSTNSAAITYLLKRGPHSASMSLRDDDNSQFGSYTTGKAGYGYRVNDALRVNANAGTNFRAPTFNELYFPGFGAPTNRPEKGKNAELGLYYDKGASRFQAVYYRNRITDLIVTTRPCINTPAVATSSCAYNVNRAMLTGLSLGASTGLGNVILRGSLDLQDPRDDTTGRRLARKASRHGVVGADYLAGPTTAGADLVFSGRRFDDAANRNSLGGYGVLSLHASHVIAPNWSVFGRWDNVLNKGYELARNFATPGASIFVGVRYLTR